jgi:hypothetical protein
MHNWSYRIHHLSPPPSSNTVENAVRIVITAGATAAREYCIDILDVFPM